MENIIYQWLKNNDNKLIEIILILSINGLHISYNKLNEYYNNIENNFITSFSNEEIIKKKRKLNNNEIELSSSNDLYGLNLNQIKLFKNYMKSLNSLKYSNELIIISNNNNNKFNNSILIIIENNKNHIPSNLIIKEVGDLLFLNKIWRNLYLKNEILFHVRLYNLHFNHIFKGDLNKLSNYKYNGYLSNIYFDNNCNIKSWYRDGTTRDSGGSLLILPSCLLNLKLPSETNYPKLKENILPCNLKSIHFGNLFNQKLNFKIIPNSITSITFGKEFNQTLDGGWLPNGLRYLEFGEKFQQSIYPGQLPSSLISLIFSKYYNGIISNLSIPETVTTLKYHLMYPRDYFEDLEENQKNRYWNSIPKFTTSLVFDHNINYQIEPFDLPHNIQTIEFGQSFNQVIKSNSFPISVKNIKFGSFFDSDINEVNSLPIHLQTLRFGHHFNRQLNSNILPNSLTSLIFGTKYNKPISNNLFINTNLIELDLGGFNHPIPPFSFPNSLIKLEIRYFNQPFQINSLPNSLKSLILSEFNHEIQINILPSNLEILKFNSFFSRFNQPIIENSLPSNLIHLEFGDIFNQKLTKNTFKNLNNLKTLILGSSFNQSLFNDDTSSPDHDDSNDTIFPSSLIEIDIGSGIPNFSNIENLPKSLKTIYYTNNHDNDNSNTININYLNNLNFNIFHKYFKFYK